MPLHRIDPSARKNKKKDDENDAPATYASDLSQQSLPRRRLPDTSVAPAVAYALVHDELLLDGNSRQNLATFCTTRVSPEVRQLMSDCIDKNMIDKDEYPQTAEIEARAVHILADLWHSPAAATTIGCSTTGSSEAAMLGGLGARNSTTAMRAVSERAKSAIPSFGYPVTYALSTVVFLIYGYLSMLLS